MGENTKNLTRSKNIPTRNETNQALPPANQTSTSALQDQWPSVLKIYKQDPINALVLAQNFQAIKDILRTGPTGVTNVVHSMDEAIETLFAFSEIYKASHELFLLAVKGTLPAGFDLTDLARQIPP
jgi:Rad3-related DNA helicase